MVLADVVAGVLCGAGVLAVLGGVLLPLVGYSLSGVCVCVCVCVCVNVCVHCLHGVCVWGGAAAYIGLHPVVCVVLGCTPARVGPTRVRACVNRPVSNKCRQAATLSCSMPQLLNRSCRQPVIHSRRLLFHRLLFHGYSFMRAQLLMQASAGCPSSPGAWSARRPHPCVAVPHPAILCSVIM